MEMTKNPFIPLELERAFFKGGSADDDVDDCEDCSGSSTSGTDIGSD
jgi:hypothetical protein